MPYPKKTYPNHLSSMDEAISFIENYILSNDKTFSSSSKIRYIPNNLWNDLFQFSKCKTDKKLEHVYWIWNNLNEYPKICPTCNKPITDFESFNQGYKSNFCSISCGYKDEEVISKKKQTSIKNYGTKFPCQSEQYQKQMSTQYLNKYGVTHPMQSREVFESSLVGKYKKKQYVLPSGKEIKLMGYEPIVADYLLNKISENEIQFTNLPSFKYNFNGKQKVYFPDIYIPYLNLIVEVKSIWTYKSDYYKNILKKQSVLNENYNFIFAIVNKDKILWI